MKWVCFIKPPAGNPAEGGHAEHRKPCINLRNERNAARAVGRASGLWCNQDHERTTRGTHGLLTELSLCLDSPLSRQGAGSDVAQRLEELIREVCATRDWEVEALTVRAGQVQLAARCSRKRVMKADTGRATNP